MSSFNFTPKCIATTGDAFCEPIKPKAQTQRRQAAQSNFFRSARFSPDGTTIITHNEDQCLRSYVLPPDLLDQREEAQVLEPYSIHQAGSNIQAYSIYPGFNLQDPSTTLVLSASAHVPITLRNALQFNTLQARYTFVHSKTEEHRPAKSLAFTTDGSHFVAGGDNVLALFDCHRDGEGPVSEHRLKPGKGSVTRYDTWSLNRKGIVSAISISGEGVVAVGTYEREVALYDNEGLGQCVSSFPLEGRTGSGVTDLKWSPDGTYLLIAERQSDIIQVYDVRYQQKMVAALTGRAAKTTQRLNIDLVPTASGYEVWAGGIDGSLRMWSNPGSKEGNHAPNADLILHRAPISSSTWHPSGAVLATCSGQRLSTPAREIAVEDESSDESGSESSSGSDSDASTEAVSAVSSDTSSFDTQTYIDNTLRVWTL